MNTTENNILIVEFMGFKSQIIDNEKSNDPIYRVWSNQHLYFDRFKINDVARENGFDNKSPNEYFLKLLSSKLRYHSSWDWLMPVLEKIASLGYKWEIGISPYKKESVFHYCKIWSIGTIEGVSPLDAVYGAVVEFVKWHNLNY
jgi:hypothetical protein